MRLRRPPRVSAAVALRPAAVPLLPARYRSEEEPERSRADQDQHARRTHSVPADSAAQGEGMTMMAHRTFPASD